MKKTMMDAYKEVTEPESKILKTEFPRPEPMKIPPFPPDLTIVSYTKLGRLRSKYCAVLAYINEVIAQSKFEVSKHRINCNRIRSGVVFATRGQKIQKLAAVQQDPSYRKAIRNHLVAKAKLDLYKNIMWSVKEYIRSVEFEVDRRHKGYRANIED